MSHPLELEMDKVSLEDLESLAKIISLEAFSATSIANILPAKRVSELVRKTGLFFKAMTFDKISPMLFSSNDLAGFVTRQGFVDSASKQVVVPESFTGQWVPYVQALYAAMTKALKINDEVLKYNTLLGKLVSDPEMLKAVSGIGSNIGYQNLNEDMVTIGKTFFNPESNHIHRELGSVIERTQDIHTTQKQLAEIVKLDSKQPASVTLKNIDRSMVLAEKLVPYIDDNNNISKAVLRDLTTVTLDLARDVEAYGTLLYRVRQFSESLKDSVKEIKK